jgi:hypothetical protein
MTRKRLDNPLVTRGMTLKDLFAAQILSGLIIHEFNHSVDIGALAEAAYRGAESMLQIRSRKEPTPVEPKEE